MNRLNLCCLFLVFLGCFFCWFVFVSLFVVLGLCACLFCFLWFWLLICACLVLVLLVLVVFSGSLSVGGEAFWLVVVSSLLVVHAFKFKEVSRKTPILFV